MSAVAGVPALYDGEHADYRESAATFLKREVVSAYREWCVVGGIPRDILAVAGEHGFLGMRVPEALGGAGVDDPRFGAIVIEECMRAAAPALALALAAHSDVAVAALMRSGADVAGCASAERIAAVVNGGVDAADGALRGTVDFVVNGAGADCFVVRTEQGRVVLVEHDAVTISQTAPPVGLEAVSFASVSFDGAAFTPLEDNATALRIDDAVAHAVGALAGARRALAVTVEYVTDRKAFGMPIADFQNTRRVLASVSGQIETVGAYLDGVLREQVAGTLRLPAAAAVKLGATDALARAVDEGVQLHGGYGYIMEYEIAHAFADARFWRLQGGTDAELLDVIAADRLR